MKKREFTSEGLESIVTALGVEFVYAFISFISMVVHEFRYILG